MSDSLGDATLNLMGDIKPLAISLSQAETMTQVAMAKMAQTVQRYSAGMGSIGERLQRQLALPAVGSPAFDRSLVSVRAGLAQLAAVADRSLGAIRTSEGLTTVAIAQGSRAQVASLGDVTRALAEQAAAARLLQGERRALGQGGAFAIPSSSRQAAYAPVPAAGGQGGGPTAAQWAQLLTELRRPAGGGGIVGVRGASQPGSIYNPVVEVAENPAYTPMGPYGVPVLTSARTSAAGTSTNVGPSSPKAPPFLYGPTPQANAARPLAGPSAFTPQDTSYYVTHPVTGQQSLRTLLVPSAPEGQPTSLGTNVGLADLMRQALANGLSDAMYQEERRAIPRATGPGLIAGEVPGHATGLGAGQPEAASSAASSHAYYAALAAAEAAAQREARTQSPGALLPVLASRAHPPTTTPVDYVDSTAEEIPTGQQDTFAAWAAADAASSSSRSAATTAASGGGGSGGGGGPPVGVALGGGGGGGGGGSSGWLTPAVMSTLLMGHRGGGGGGGSRFLPWFLRGFAGVGAGLGSLGSFAGLGPEHILATGLGIAGSAGTAVGGAGLLGLGAAGQLAVGGGSDLGVLKSTVSDTQQISQAYTVLSTAVATYGKNSRQAALAQQQLNVLIKTLGDTVGVKAEQTLAKNADALNTLFDATSGAARVQAANILEQGVHLGDVYLPLVLKAATQNLAIINQDIKPLFAWLEGPEGIQIWDNLEANFKKNLPDAIHAFVQGVELLLRVTSLASDYTGGFTKHLDDLFTRLNSDSNEKLDSEIGHLVGQFRDWEALVKIIGLDIVDLFDQDAGTGTSIVTTLTAMLTKLHTWEESTKGSGQLHTIFEVHKQEVLELLGLLPKLVSGFGSIYLTLAPALTGAFTTVLKAINAVLKGVESIGPLGTDLVGVLLVASKLFGFGATLRGIGTGLGTIGRALPGVAAGEKEVAGAGGLGGSAASGASAAEGAAAGGLGGAEEAAGAAGFVTLLKGAVVSGGLGILLGDVVQHALKLRGGTVGTLLFGGLGAAIGSIFGPMGTAAGGALGATFGPSVEHLLAGLFGLKPAKDYGKAYGNSFATGFLADAKDQFTKGVYNSLHAGIASAEAKLKDTQIQIGQAKVAVAGGGPNAATIAALRRYAQSVPALEGEGRLSPQAGASAIASVNAQIAALEKTGRQSLSRASQALAPEAKVAGQQIGQALIDSIRGAQFPSVPAIASDLVGKIRGQIPAVKEAAVGQVQSYVQGLVDEGDLAPNAWQQILDKVKATFPTLNIAAQQQAAGLAAILQYPNAQSNIVTFLNQVRGQFAISLNDPVVTGSTWLSNFQLNMYKLGEIGQYATSELTRGVTKNATQMYEQYHEQGDKLTSGAGLQFGELTGTARTQMQLLQTEVVNAMTRGKTLGLRQLSDLTTSSKYQFGLLSGQAKSGSQTAAQAIEALLGTTNSSIKALVSAGVLTQKQGNQMIVSQTNAALKALGSPKQIHIASVDSALSGHSGGSDALPNNATLGATLQAGPGGVGSAAGKFASGLSAAQGLLVQVGRAGDRGPDTIPMTVGGQNIVVGSGEKVAVFNHDQQAVLDHHLASYGGLGGFFKAVNTPHHFAGGGFVEAPGTNYSVGEEPILVQRLTAMAKALGIELVGISGYRSPAHSVEVGGFANDPHTRGDASDTEGAQDIPESVLERFGLTRLFPGAAEADHIQLLGVALGAIIASATGAGAVSALLAPSIQTPQVGGTGAMADMIQGALTATASAAQSLVSQSGGSNVATGRLVPGIMSIEERAARIAGLSWDPTVVRELLSKESAGGVNEPPSGSLSATGPNQVTPPTFAAYALPGYSDINDPLDNAVAGDRWIRSKYGSFAAMASATGLFTSGYKGYAGGGEFDPTATIALSASSPHTSKPGTGVPAKKPSKRAQSHPKGTKPPRLSIGGGLRNLALISPAYAALVAPLIGLGGDTGTAGELGALTSALGALQELPVDVTDGGGPAAGDYILNAAYVADLAPYVADLATLGVPLGGSFTPGMSYGQAYGLYKTSLAAYNADVQASGSTDANTAWGDNLSDVQQILDALGSDPARRIINRDDMTILDEADLRQPSGNGANATPNWTTVGAPGSPLDQVEAYLDEYLIGVYKEVLGEGETIEKRLQKDIPAFTARQANVYALEELDVRRLKGIQAQEAKLKLVDAKAKLVVADARLAATKQETALDASSAKTEVERAAAGVKSANQAVSYAQAGARLEDVIAALTTTQGVYTAGAQASDVRSAIGKLSQEVANENAQPIANTLYVAQLNAVKQQYQNEETALAEQSAEITAQKGSYQAQLDKMRAQQSVKTGQESVVSALYSSALATDASEKQTISDQLSLLEAFYAQQAAQRAVLETSLSNSLTPIEANLKVLGGDTTAAGKAGAPNGSIYGALSGALSRMATGLSSDETMISTATGDLPNRQGDLTTMTSNLGSSFDTTLLGAVSSSADAQDQSELVQVQAQQIQALGTLNAILEDQYAVLKRLPPFAGAFATGGVVPGLPGAPAMALVHGGERITPLGEDSTRVHVRVEDHRTRVWVNEREHASSTIARRASRGLPGAGGGGVGRPRV